jgi:hypothetical protein
MLRIEHFQMKERVTPGFSGGEPNERFEATRRAGFPVRLQPVVQAAYWNWKASCLNPVRLTPPLNLFTAQSAVRSPA